VGTFAFAFAFDINSKSKQMETKGNKRKQKEPKETKPLKRTQMNQNKGGISAQQEGNLGSLKRSPKKLKYFPAI